MKELTIEQKAQRYDEVLEKARQLCAYPTTKPFISDLQDFFPELKESEDERIKKCVKYAIDKLFLKEKIVCDVRKNDVLAWLEKQGEQDPYNGVSFKYNGHTWGMCARDNGVDILLDRQLIKHLEKQGEKYIENYDEKIRKGLISFFTERAKYTEDSTFNGLSSKEIIAWLEKQDEKKPADKVEPKFKVGDIIKPKCYNETHSIKAIGERYYILDVDIKIPFRDEDDWELVGQNSAWSAEDEYCIHQLIVFCENCMVQDAGAKRCAHWLKSLKNRYTWKPSGEQMKYLHKYAEQNNYDGAILTSLYNDLKQLKQL